MALLRIGTAGWSIPAQHAGGFATIGTHLQRYALGMNAVEINSSFYRPHRPATYARWAASTPEDFRFAVKLPQEISHTRRLVDAAAPLEAFLAQVGCLGDRLGPLLLQLPPSLAFHPQVAPGFLQMLRSRFDGGLVCEPRHASWFTPQVDRLMDGLRIARVAADPAVVPQAVNAGGWPGLVYHRLHGSPRIYYSAYPEAALLDIAEQLRHAAASGAEVWCIFDNTAEGEALRDAQRLRAMLEVT
jgi:uncharacterized protein YecE (DUF72 family)